MQTQPLTDLQRKKLMALIGFQMFVTVTPFMLVICPMAACVLLSLDSPAASSPAFVCGGVLAFLLFVVTVANLWSTIGVWRDRSIQSDPAHRNRPAPPSQRRA